jgi:8-oxo-dGTP pyrophosphatase MutT (NUDIX family)
MERFSRSKTEQVGDFHFFALEKHAMVDADGRPVRDAYTFACPDWASVAAITTGGEFVLVRQYRHGIDGPSLEVPGGLIDAGEDPAVAARRELREETGYGGGTLISLGHTHPNPVLQNNRLHMFLVRDACRLGEPQFDETEHCELVLASPDTVRRYSRDGTITHALVLLTLARAWEALAEDAVLQLLAGMEQLQASKVIELARRLRPGLTAEDIRNPHDFPELADVDWHFEDGQLAGIQSVITAVRALRGRLGETSP